MSTTVHSAQAIAKALSAPRMATYESAVNCPAGSPQAVELYNWNAAVSSALMHPLHICEVVIRNAISESIQQVYGQHWPWASGFEQSLPQRDRHDLQRARDPFTHNHRTSKVIPELKFVFWQKMLTQRHDHRIWSHHLAGAFPNLPVGSVSQNRGLLHGELEIIRKLRNRIAHHEPILTRNLNDDFTKIMEVIGYRCTETGGWAAACTNAYTLINNRPSTATQTGNPAANPGHSLFGQFGCVLLGRSDEYLSTRGGWQNADAYHRHIAIRTINDCGCPDCSTAAHILRAIGKYF